MVRVLTKSASFILIIIMGLLCRRYGLVSKEEGKNLGKLIMNFTMPCMLAISFTGVTFNFWMVVAIFLGILMSVVSATIARFTIARGRTGKEKANFMLCCSGSNVGSYVIPFCQSFFPAEAIGALAMFDIGNCVMSLGGTYAYAKMVMEGKKKLDLSEVGKNLMTSVPFLTYAVLAILALFHISLPALAVDLISPIGQANVFLIMFMIGTQMELNMDPEKYGDVAKIVVLRTLFAVVFAGLIYLLPADPTFKKVLMLIPFGPIASPTIIYVQKLDCDTSLAAMASSVTMPLAIAVFSALMLVL